MKKLLFVLSIVSLIVGLTLESRGLIAISLILILFTILEMVHTKDERELSDWYKEIKERSINDIDDWHWKELEEEKKEITNKN